MNKDFKIYATRLANNISVKPKQIEGEKKKFNLSTASKSVQKQTMRISKKNKSLKAIDADRRKTLPKMRTYKI